MRHQKIPKKPLLIVAVVAGSVGLYALINSLAATSKIFYVDVNSTNGQCSDSRTAAQVAQNAPLCSINKAVELATGGETINVVPGTYGPIRLIRYLPETVTIRGVGATKPVIKGSPELNNGDTIAIAGGSNLTFESLTIRNGRAHIGSHPVKKTAQVSRDITFTNVEFTGNDAGYGHGLTIRDGSKNIKVENSHFHHLMSGITGPNYRIIGGVENDLPNVDGVIVRNNLMEYFKADAMQFAGWDNVIIDRNVMQHSQHDPPPAEPYHNDLIQFTGYSKNVRITNNYLADSSQHIFIQPAFGPISDVVVENNVIWKSRAYAVQSQGIPGFRFVNNTMWDTVYGFIIRGGPNGEPAPTDGIVTNNIITSIAGAPAGTIEDYNIVMNLNPKRTYGSHDILGADPKFVNAAAGDFHLASGSPAIGAGTAQYAPAGDLENHGRNGAPDIGAYEFDGGAPPTPPTQPPSGGTPKKATSPVPVVAGMVRSTSSTSASSSVSIMSTTLPATSPARAATLTEK